MLAAYPPGSIVTLFTPHLKVKDPKTEQYVDIKDVKESTFQNITNAKGIPTSAEGVASAFGVPTIPTLPTLPTIPTIPTLPTIPTIPTLPTIPTIPKKGGTRKCKNIRKSSRRNKF